MKKIEEVYLFIQKNTSIRNLKENILLGNKVGIDAKEIEKELGIVRNNASTLLNMLNKKGELVKIRGRPVRFIPTKVLKDLFSATNIAQEYNLEDLKKILTASKDEKKLESDDPFKSLFCSSLSLKAQINQAKAAIMYPPNGLHTLIVGPSGVGKTTFANTMYKYALKVKEKTQQEYPFISFNCSDYYNNPQLLLSQLFGHIKGAFTGADRDKVGLVEKADGGILFLDEVHRLPPDGQEMLFYLMDNGEYHRLGETENIRKSQILIIAATTEKPQKVLLKTFLRRIPVVISLPSLKEIDMGERINIVENLFTEEAIRINRKLIVSSEVLRALVVYECKGNIGQLKSDIKLLCAKAFLKYLQSNENLKIEFSMLPKFIKDSIFNLGKLDSESLEYLNVLNEDRIIYPSKSVHGNREKSSENIYKKIAERLQELKRKGLSDEKIDIEIGKEIEDYFKSVIKKFNYETFNIRELYKVIDKEIVDFAVELINFASKKLGKEFNNKIIFGLAFHLKSLIERVKKKEPIVNHELSKIKEIYINEYEVASAVVKKIEERFDLQIPVDENGFIAILLANNEVESADEDKIGILIITHGNSTATSMARVCNRLLNSNFVKAIDMPLEKEVSEIYQKTLVTVKSIDRGKGVIILVDMGSLKEFGEKITEETGIITRTIDRVSTPLVLEVLRRVMYKKESIDKIYESFKNDSKDSIEEITYKKEKAIMTVCTTGKGTSIMLQNILSNILQESGNDDINIIPINYTAIESNSKEYKNMQQKYDFIACVGNIKPEIDIPFFSVEDIVNEQFRYKFNRFVESKVKIKEVEDKKSSYDTAKKMLEEFTLYINPKKAVNFIEKFIESLDFQELNNDDTLKTNLTVHLGFMIERVITCKRAVFEELDIFKSKHKSQFERIRKSIKILEDPYKIKIGDNEICYILQVINGRHQKT